MSTNIKRYSFQDEDDFERRIIAQKLVDLLLSNIDMSPIIIDGHWGVGKTTFCKKTIELLEDNIKAEKHNIKCAYIDTFIADHANQPLITLIAAISRLIDSKNNKQDEFINHAIGVARFGLKTLAKAGTSWILKQNAEKLGKELAEALSNNDEVINKAVNSIIKEHEKAEDNINALKEILLDITKEQKLVIFLDELDRCRPDFAIAILESIKHIFDVEGIKFVLIANYKQMRAAINHCYGSDVDAQRYLDKFIKFSFTLPYEVGNKKNIFASTEYAKKLIQQSDSLKNTSIIVSDRQLFLFDLIKKNTLSLREVEKFIRHLEIYQKIIGPGGPLNQHEIFSSLYILSVYIYIFVPDIYIKIEKEQVLSDELISLIGVNIPKKPHNKINITQIIGALIDISLNDSRHYDQSDIEEWKKEFHSYFKNELNSQTLYSFFRDEFRKMRFQF